MPTKEIIDELTQNNSVVTMFFSSGLLVWGIGMMITTLGIFFSWIIQSFSNKKLENNWKNIISSTLKETLNDLANNLNSLKNASHLRAYYNTDIMDWLFESRDIFLFRKNSDLYKSLIKLREILKSNNDVKEIFEVNLWNLLEEIVKYFEIIKEPYEIAKELQSLRCKYKDKFKTH